MLGVTYSLIGILAVVIHMIINRDILFLKKEEKALSVRVHYSRFLWGVLGYYVTDALWGILDELGWLNLLKADTFIYYVAMSLAVVLWCDYVVSYLQQNNIFGKILRYFGRIFVLFELGALIVNIFYPFFFWFDDSGAYHAGPIRYAALYIQITLFMLSSIYTLVITLRSNNMHRIRHTAICIFAVSMMIAIIIQIGYPLLPIYSIGYLIGSCFLHAYVEEDEKAEHYENLKRQMDIVSSMSGIYFCSYYVDMKTKKYEELNNKIIENAEIIGKSGDAVETLDNMCKNLVLPQYEKELLEFTNLDTLDKRMENSKYYISTQFESVHLGWAEGFFIAGDRDKNGKLAHVIWAIRTIHDEKEKEEKLLYNSYIDELTGLYNRKMYADNIEEGYEVLNNENFVFISMDVNGLKEINDTKGHAAGDELIKGAAECMKKCMGNYGRIYRTGGDEFIALISADDEQLAKIKTDFNSLTADYHGIFVDSISVSCGYVAKRDYTNLSLEEIEKLADKNMYTAKQIHYTANGIDSRNQQQNAYKALCALYTKILLINLQEDKYSIIYMKADEQTEEKGFTDGIFSWFENFAKSGQVHPDDKEHYLSLTSKEYLCNYFNNDKTSLTVSYRRMTDGRFKMSEMEMIPAKNYSNDNQNIFLYVKSVDK